MVQMKSRSVGGSDACLCIIHFDPQAIAVEISVENTKIRVRISTP